MVRVNYFCITYTFELLCQQLFWEPNHRPGSFAAARCQLPLEPFLPSFWHPNHTKHRIRHSPTFFWKLDFESIGNRMLRFQSSFCHPNHTAQNYTSSKSNSRHFFGKIRLRKVTLPTTLTELKMEWHKENIFYRGDWRRWRVWEIWSHFHSDVLLHLKL